MSFPLIDIWFAWNATRFRTGIHKENWISLLLNVQSNLPSKNLFLCSPLFVLLISVHSVWIISKALRDLLNALNMFTSAFWCWFVFISLKNKRDREQPSTVTLVMHGQWACSKNDGCHKQTHAQFTLRSIHILWWGSIKVLVTEEEEKKKRIFLLLKCRYKQKMYPLLTVGN